MEEDKLKNDQNVSKKELEQSKDEDLDEDESGIDEANGANEDDSAPQKSQLYLFEVTAIWFFFVLPADICDIFSLTGVGAVLSWVLDVISFLAVGIWLLMRGRRGAWVAIANLIEFIPVIDVLPWRSAALWILYFKERIPYDKMVGVAEKLEKADQALGKVYQKFKK